MNKNKLWVMGAVFAMLMIIGGGWLFGIQPQLSSISSAHQKRANAQIQNASNQALLIKLKRDYQNIAALKEQLSSLRVAVPSSAEISTFVTELNALASLYKVTVKSISVSDAKPYAPAAPTSGTSPSATTADPRITAANFILVPVQLSVAGPYAKVLDFVHQLQIGPRLFFVSTLSSNGSTDAQGTANAKRSTATTSEKVDATIGGFVYVLLDKFQK